MQSCLVPSSRNALIICPDCTLFQPSSDQTLEYNRRKREYLDTLPKRTRVALEIVESEESYVHSLTLLVIIHPRISLDVHVLSLNLSALGSFVQTFCFLPPYTVLSLVMLEWE